MISTSAVTVPRGGTPGYPHDRKVYASWSKPIVVMCNQNSFSNAEIFSHAIKSLNRGQLVGVPTAGGVISTGSVGLVDGGTVRTPMRSWSLIGTAEDKELNSCELDIAFWDDPLWAALGGQDLQLTKAVEALAEDVAVGNAKDRVKLVPAARLRK